MYTWPVDRTCLPDVSDGSTEDQIKMQEAINTAVGVLWALTGRTYAVERVEIRPCARWMDGADYADGTAMGMVPLLIDGAWRNVSGCASSCTPDGLGVVTLPGPVVEILAVRVDGVPVASESWFLEGDRLYRRGGDWPEQDRMAAPGEPGTWSVEYTRGVAPPAGAAMAVGQLAKEFWNVCQGGKCRLPKRWQTVTRSGVTITKADPTDILAQGYTGLPEVDTWIRALNPNKLTQPAVVASPDYSSTVRY